MIHEPMLPTPRCFTHASAYAPTVHPTAWPHVRRPSGAAALSAAEAALADKTAWEGCDGGMAAALARRGRLRIEAGGDWRAAEADARAAKELDSEAEEPRWLLAEIMYRSRRRQVADWRRDAISARARGE